VEHYNATAQIHTRDLEHLIDQLATHSAAAGPIGGNWVEVTFTLPADHLEQAARTALALLTHASGGAEVRHFEILTTDAFDARQGLALLPPLVSVTEAASVLHITRQAVLQRLENGSLPGRKVGNTWVVPAAALA
jgi:excisionase family DNA binding protein